MRKFLATLEDRIDSEYVFVMADVFKLLLGVLISSHLLACFFFAVGQSGGNGSWGDQLKGASMEYKYTTALHWGFSSLILESTDMEPSNTGERIFTVFALIMGLLIFSAVVSRLTAAIMKLQDMTQDHSKQFWLLRKYLAQRRVPRQLGHRIQRFLEHATEQQALFIQESKVQMLGYLSRNLCIELQYSIAARVICSHLYFGRVGEISEVMMHRICDQALSKQTLAREDPLFVKGDLGLRMHFVVSGELVYSRKDLDRVLQPRTNLCEPVLWCEWFHLGSAKACTECETISIDAASFSHALQTNHLIWVRTRAYAKHFVEALNEDDPSLVSDLTNYLSIALKNYLLTCFAKGCSDDTGSGSEVRMSCSTTHLASSASVVPIDCAAPLESKHVREEPAQPPITAPPRFTDSLIKESADNLRVSEM